MNRRRAKWLGATILVAVVFGQGCVPLWFNGIGTMAGTQNNRQTMQKLVYAHIPGLFVYVDCFSKSECEALLRGSLDLRHRGVLCDSW